MNIPVTVEIIPVRKFPIQGSIMAEILTLEDEVLRIVVFEEFRGFIEVGDIVPIIARYHYQSGSEQEMEMQIKNIEGKNGRSIVTSTIIGNRGVSEILRTAINQAKRNNNILKLVGERRMT